MSNLAIVGYIAVILFAENEHYTKTKLACSKKGRSDVVLLVRWDPIYISVQASYTASRVFSDERGIFSGMLTAMDFAIGRLVDYLKSANLYDNTVIVFTSDVGRITAVIPTKWVSEWRNI